MSSLIQKIQESIKKLNQIDIGAQFAKLKEIKVEDLKNLSLFDLRAKADPMTLSLVGSVVLVGAGLYGVSLPEWRSWDLNRETLQQYRSEAEQVPLLRATLNNLKKQQEELGEDFDIVRGFVSEESIELFTSKFFTEIAKRSNVRLLGVNPMMAGAPITCIQPDMSDQLSDDLLPPEPPADPGQMDPSLPPADVPGSEAPLASDLASLFKVNRFQLSLRGNYLNVMDYLRYLNQYQQTLSPVCLEVFSTPIAPAPEASSGAGGNPEPQYVGEVNVKLIVDIPQRELPPPKSS